ncbi:MAG: TlpA family protein disulfide reductase [Planctomycetes bacterium]|nr:TlpA family protein disulfide reductase [Planctomycetota bacterium]
MRGLKSLLWAMASCTCVAVPGSAVAGQTRDPRELLTQADAATREVRAVKYNVESTMRSPSSEVTIKAAVRLKQIGDKTESGLPLFLVDGSAAGAGGEVRIVSINDGDELALVDFKSKEIRRGRSVADEREADSELVWFFRNAWMHEFNHPRPFGDEIEGDDHKYEGRARAGGVECEIVSVKYKGLEQRARWFFGVEDHLPRRVERILGGAARSVMELTNLVVNPALDDAAFSLKSPPEIEENQSGIIRPGQPAPAFSLATPDGKTISLIDQKGRVVLLAFWSSKIAPSQKALPVIQRISESAGKDVAVYGVLVWDDQDPTALLKENGCSFPVLLKGDALADECRIDKAPVFIVIGRDGKIAYTAIGIDAKREDEVRKAVERAVAEHE